MKETNIMIKQCEVCKSLNLKSVLDLGKHPMCDDLVSIKEKRLCKEYKIEILFCDKCKTAHQKYQVPKKDLFPKSYHYRSRLTKDVVNGMNDLVNSYKKKFGIIKNKKVLDIGCNDGSLLKIFRENGANIFGIEPTNAANEAKKVTKNIFQDYLSVELANHIVSNYDKPDIITFTNVFAHIENLGEVIVALKILMKKDTVLIIENHYLLSILKSNQFDTFYHEHPRSYSFNSFLEIVKNLSAVITHCEFPSRYGGNIRVFCSLDKTIKIQKSLEEKILSTETNFEKMFFKMNDFLNSWKKIKKQEILNLNKKFGPLKAKAFPGRAAILIKLLDLNHKNISNIYEKPNSKKINHYVPGTRIPIISDDKLFEDKDFDQPIINFAWHISKEIKSYLIENNFKGKIINIL